MQFSDFNNLYKLQVKMNVSGYSQVFKKYLSKRRIDRGARPKVHDVFNSDIKCSQDDRVIINYIWEFHLIPPSTKQYNLTRGIQGLEKDVKQALKKALGSNFQKSGFFVECGANDGEFLSNTIELETTYGWNGLLIEASPSLFRKMKTKNRRAWLSDICLSSELLEKIEFTRHKDSFHEWKIGVGRVNPEKTQERTLLNPQSYMWAGQEWSKDDFTSEGLVECFPLYSVLKALSVETVDFFSLDVEGDELSILKAIPYHRLNITAIYVENRGHTAEDKLSMKELLFGNGYRLALDTGTDYLFVIS